MHDSFEPARHADPAKYKGMHARAKAGARETHVQPLVRIHPETGRASLYISPYYTTRIEGMTEEESRPLLDFLAGHAVKPEFTCRFNWAPYSIAVWDNRCSLHNALDDDFTARATGRGFKRVMRRATIAGDRPRGPNDSQPAAGEAKRRQPPELGRKKT